MSQKIHVALNTNKFDESVAFYRSFFGNQLRPGSPAMGATVASSMFLIILLGVLVYTFAWQRRVTTYEL